MGIAVWKIEESGLKVGSGEGAIESSFGTGEPRKCWEEETGEACSGELGENRGAVVGSEASRCGLVFCRPETESPETERLELERPEAGPKSEVSLDAAVVLPERAGGGSVSGVPGLGPAIWKRRKRPPGSSAPKKTGSPACRVRKWGKGSKAKVRPKRGAE